MQTQPAPDRVTAAARALLPHLLTAADRGEVISRARGAELVGSDRLFRAALAHLVETGAATVIFDREAGGYRLPCTGEEVLAEAARLLSYIGTLQRRHQGLVRYAGTLRLGA
jgi:hypothetical protein